MSRRFAVLATGSAAALLLAAGCRDPWVARRPHRVPVMGAVFYNGQPVGEATVLFVAQGEGYPAAGLTDAAGRFELQTFEASDGAVPGDYLVTIRKVQVVPHPTSPGDIEEFPQVPAQYARAQTTDLTASVVDGQANQFRFDLRDPLSGAGDLHDLQAPFGRDSLAGE